MSAPSPNLVEQPSDDAAAFARDAYFSHHLQSADDFVAVELGPAVRSYPGKWAEGLTRRAIAEQSARLETLLGLWQTQHECVDCYSHAFPTADQLYVNLHPAPLSFSAVDGSVARQTALDPPLSPGHKLPADEAYIAIVAEQLFGATGENAA